MAAWQERFTAPEVRFPVWSPIRPEYIAFLAAESGTLQVWMEDLTTGKRRQLTDVPAGVERLLMLPNGEGVVWWLDETGDESGRWQVTRFEDRQDGELFPGLGEAWSEGIGLGAATAAAAMTDGTGYRIVTRIGDGPPAILAEAPFPLGIGREWEFGWNGVSADGTLVCVRSHDEGDITRARLKVLDTRDGALRGEIHDDGLHLRFSAWSPAGPLIAFAHERDGRLLPGIWNGATGERRDLTPELPGSVDPLGWWPDGSTLLARHELDGRATLVRIDPATGAARRAFPTDGGWIEQAGVRPDGRVWARVESGADPPLTRDDTGAVIGGPTRPPPEGRPYADLEFHNPRGDRIHGFLAAPAGSPPFPIVLAVHGGPDWAYHDAFDPEIQAFVDNGYAVAMINYRGSTGYGVAHATALRGNFGFPEVEDVVAGLDVLVERGVANPSAVAIQGWSWGGYIALLAAGLHPSRFAAVVAGIPTADLVACHEDANPAQQDWDVAMLGGTPQQLPEVYRERSPITYVDRVRAPVLMIAGEHDSACPIRQVRNYEHALRDRGRHVETLIYEAGHHALASAERLRFMEAQLDFLRRTLSGR